MSGLQTIEKWISRRLRLDMQKKTTTKKPLQDLLICLGIRLPLPPEIIKFQFLVILSGRKGAPLCVQTGSKDRTEPAVRKVMLKDFICLVKKKCKSVTALLTHSKTDMEPGGSQ